MVAPSQFVMQGKWKARSDLAEKFSHKPARLHTQPIDGHMSLLMPMEVVTIPPRLISDWKDYAYSRAHCPSVDMNGKPSPYHRMLLAG